MFYSEVLHVLNDRIMLKSLTKFILNQSLTLPDLAQLEISYKREGRGKAGYKVQSRDVVL